MDRETATHGDGRSFEAALDALEAIVTRLETGSLTLDEALAAFEAGVRLARECESRLDGAERRVEVLLEGPDGSLRAEPFDPDPRPADEGPTPSANGPGGRAAAG